ncbi:MAG TPA: acetylornithine transaminase [Moorella mulderi]|nr:acetylornithine transaminase [Moorella mulderi]
MDTSAWIALGEKYIMSTYARQPLVLVRGQGTRVWDVEGREYLDFVGGIAVNSLGHCHPRVVEALKDQAQKLLHCSNLYWNIPQIQLAQLLVEHSALDKVFFCNSGAEAVEAAIKLARKYAKERLGPDKYEIITMRRSFHGRTMGALAATGQEKLHQGFAPLPPGFRYVPFNDLDSLKAALSPHTCAIMLEPVQGEGGVHVAEEDYLQGVAEICRKQGLLLIFDEIQCGLGRTGYLFACEHYGIEPDIMTLAKALGGGVAIGAMLAKEEVARAFRPGDHASTFGGNPLATAAGAAAFKALLEEDLINRARTLGEYLYYRLEELAHKFPSLVVEVRGRGLLLGMEMRIPVAPVVEACREKGLLVNGVQGNVLRLVPPLVVSKQEIDQALCIIKEVLEKISWEEGSCAYGQT